MRLTARRLILKAAARLRRGGYRTTRLVLHARLAHGGDWWREARLPATDDSFALVSVLARLWLALAQALHDRDAHVRTIGVTLADVQSADADQGVPAGVLTGPPTPTERLSRALDAINTRCGRNAATLGPLTGGRIDRMGAKIAFGRIPRQARSPSKGPCLGRKRPDRLQRTPQTCGSSQASLWWLTKRATFRKRLHSIACVGAEMESVSPELFLLDQFPRQYWPLVPATLTTAYDTAKRLAADEPILQVESAQDNHGRLISWAVDFGFARLIESGRLPFEYRWRPFAKPTGRYLEIRLPQSVISISQVVEPDKQPRNVEFRKNGRLNNEPCFDLPEFDSEQQIRGLPHFLITHGHQTLEFAHVGVPHPTHSCGFRYISPNLMRLPHELANDLPKAENTDTDFEAINLLKQDIEQWRRDNGV